MIHIKTAYGLLKRLEEMQDDFNEVQEDIRHNGGKTTLEIVDCFRQMAAHMFAMHALQNELKIFIFEDTWERGLYFLERKEEFLKQHEIEEEEQLAD